MSVELDISDLVPILSVGRPPKVDPLDRQMCRTSDPFSQWQAL